MSSSRKLPIAHDEVARALTSWRQALERVSASTDLETSLTATGLVAAYLGRYSTVAALVEITSAPDSALVRLAALVCAGDDWNLRIDDVIAAACALRLREMIASHES